MMWTRMRYRLIHVVNTRIRTNLMHYEPIYVESKNLSIFNVNNPLTSCTNKCRKYGMKVIVDLHALKASQNGNEHSGARDGYQEWGDSNIDETVAVIEFLAARLRKQHSSLLEK